jgi:hypothetical protein
MQLVRLVEVDNLKKRARRDGVKKEQNLQGVADTEAGGQGQKSYWNETIGLTIEKYETGLTGRFLLFAVSDTALPGKFPGLWPFGRHVPDVP